MGAPVPETPFPRMHYDEAMSRFGTDRPDTRFGLEITDIYARPSLGYPEHTLTQKNHLTNKYILADYPILLGIILVDVAKEQ